MVFRVSGGYIGMNDRRSAFIGMATSCATPTRRPQIVFPFGDRRPTDCRRLGWEWQWIRLITVAHWQFLLRNSNTEAAEMSFYLGNVGMWGRRRLG
jgi:hypothetical protein